MWNITVNDHKKQLATFAIQNSAIYIDFHVYYYNKLVQIYIWVYILQYNKI